MLFHTVHSTCLDTFKDTTITRGWCLKDTHQTTSSKIRQIKQQKKMSSRQIA